MQDPGSGERQLCNMPYPCQACSQVCVQRKQRCHCGGVWHQHVHQQRRRYLLDRCTKRQPSP
ncbi:hypothetical protein DPMN_058223 [Dreissena polymorpha]|uniref:Uncharacterized protein n=1 Tax=Dreissena polymorpha TaxID=45954 RepID=A0A9D4C1D4_DREPO|nr:hypothetical protein DPMN_058223 [Dreissena polymorpha]